MDTGAFDDWFERISNMVGTVIEGVGRIVGVVQGSDGKHYYETDTGDYIPVNNVVPDNSAGGVDSTMLLILLAVVILSRR